MDTEKNEDWENEFREYFDKTLKPKKPTMKNLDRELCVNFIKNTIRSLRQSNKELILGKMEEEAEALRSGKFCYCGEEVCKNPSCYRACGRGIDTCKSIVEEVMR